MRTASASPAQTTSTAGWFRPPTIEVVSSQRRRCSTPGGWSRARVQRDEQAAVIMGFLLWSKGMDRGMFPALDEAGAAHEGAVFIDLFC